MGLIKKNQQIEELECDYNFNHNASLISSCRFCYMYPARMSASTRSSGFKLDNFLPLIAI